MLLLIGILAAGCAAPMGDRAPVEDSMPGSGATSSPSGPVNSPAVLELSSNARSAMQQGRYDSAVQLLERAIRIEPHNGLLWHELARVRYEQGSYEQAMQLANRSNAAASISGTLKRKNEELIKRSRQALSY